MPRLIATIQLPADFQFDGEYKHKGQTYIGHEKARERYQVSRNALAQFREADQVRFIKFSRAGSTGWGILNHEGDLAAAAALYHRSQSERYKQAERQRGANGEWRLAPRAFERLVGIGPTTRLSWDDGIPILRGEKPDIEELSDGNGEKAPFYLESQAKRIVKAQQAQAQGSTIADAAEQSDLPFGRVRRWARERKKKLKAKKKPERVGPRTVHKLRLAPKALDKMVQDEERKRKIEDPISPEEVAPLCGVNPATIRRWYRKGKIKFEDWGHDDRGGRRHVVSKSEALAFASSQAAVRGTGGNEPWLLERQVLAQHPDVPKDTLKERLKYYATHDLPSLDRPIHTRTVERPAGLTCPYETVRQFWASDIPVLIEWLRAPKRPLGPCVQRAIDFLKLYLADGRDYSRQDIIPAAAKKGIKTPWLDAALPHIPELVKTTDSSRGRGRFNKYRIAHANGSANGASSQTAAATAHATEPAPKRRGPGRPAGSLDPAARRRRQLMIDDWRKGQYQTVADLARAHRVDRSTASKILKDAGLTA